MATRKQIRDAIKTGLAAVYNGSIHTSRLVDVREENEFVTIALIEGGVVSGEQAGAKADAMQLAQLVIGYSKKLVVPSDPEAPMLLPSDDDLDAVIEALDQVVTSKTFLRGLIAGVLYSGFEYPDDAEREFSSVKYTYDIYY